MKPQCTYTALGEGHKDMKLATRYAYPMAVQGYIANLISHIPDANRSVIVPNRVRAIT